MTINHGHAFRDPTIAKMAAVAASLEARMEVAAPPKPLLDELREQREALRVEDTAAIEAREAERAAFEARADKTEADLQANLDAERSYAEAKDRRAKEIKVLTRRIGEQKTLDRRRASAARASRSTVTVRSEPLTYREDNAHELSYFADLLATTSPKHEAVMTRRTKRDSEARLIRHAQEMAVELPKKEAARRLAATREIERSVEQRVAGSMSDPFRRYDDSPFGAEYRITPNRTDGYGGYFVPPQWVDAYIKGLRPSRVTANLCKNLDLPGGTDVIVVPKLANLTTVAIQGADNAPVAETDWSDTAVVAPVKTLAGMSDVPVQLLDQSPYPVDQMILQDLLADYDKKFDAQIVAGNGAVSNSVTPTVGGQIAGLYSSAGASNWTSYNPITYTSGSPAPWHAFSIFGALASNIAENRFMFDDTFSIVVHPRRAWWFLTGVDSNNRPLVESSNFGPFNVAAVEPGSVPAQGLVAQLPWGHRVYASANVPTTDTAGGGTNQDVALGFLGSDAWVFEGQMHTDVLPEVLSGNLQVRFRVYAYAAFLLRYGQSLAIAAGTGFAAPTGAVSSITF